MSMIVVVAVVVVVVVDSNIEPYTSKGLGKQ